MISELRMLLNNVELHAMAGRFDAARSALQRASGVIHRMDAASGPTERPETWEQLTDEEIAELVCDDRR